MLWMEGYGGVHRGFVMTSHANRVCLDTCEGMHNTKINKKTIYCSTMMERNISVLYRDTMVFILF